jgi:hypothetical protein
VPSARCSTFAAAAATVRGTEAGVASVSARACAWCWWSCDSGVKKQRWCSLEATNTCIGVPALRAKALARFILVKWRRRLRVSLSLLRASFWSCNPPARGHWVKTRSSSWTSDGGACGRRDLLGGVVSRDTVRRLGRPAARDLLRPVVTNLSEGVRRRGLPTSRQDASSSVGGWGSSLGLLFACLQRSAAHGAAWQSPVRCGTAFKGRR